MCNPFDMMLQPLLVMARLQVELDLLVQALKAYVLRSKGPCGQSPKECGVTHTSPYQCAFLGRMAALGPTVYT